MGKMQSCGAFLDLELCFEGVIWRYSLSYKRLLSLERLKERFDKGNGSRIFSIHREISVLTQGSNSVSGYFTKLK